MSRFILNHLGVELQRCYTELLLERVPAHLLGHVERLAERYSRCASTLPR